MPTDEQWKTLVRIVKRKLNEHDDAIGQLWEKLGELHEAEAGMVDEAVDDIGRLRRSITRLTKRVEQMEND